MGRSPEATGQGGSQAHTQLELMESGSLQSLAEKKKKAVPMQTNENVSRAEY